MKSLYWTLIFSFLMALPAMAQSLGSLFQNKEMLHLGLEYDITRLQAEKETLREIGLPAILNFEGRSFQIEVSPRGAGSFQCQQPQLKLNLKNAQTAETAFQGFKKLRLFTTGGCIPNGTDEMRDKSILANYLQYRLVELISPYHFKTRLVKIAYKDLSGKIPDYEQLAFFLEPENHIQSRLGLTKIAEDTYDKIIPEIMEKLDPHAHSLANAFEMLIGNFDYGIPGFFSPIAKGIARFHKNVDLYKDGQGRIFPFVYDFDFSRLSFNSGYCWAGLSIEEVTYGNKMNIVPQCDEDQIMKALAADLNSVPWKKDLILHEQALQISVSQWLQDNKEELAILGSKYISEVQLLMNSLSKSLEIRAP